MSYFFKGDALPDAPANLNNGVASFDSDVVWLKADGSRVVIVAQGQMCSDVYAEALRAAFVDAPKGKAKDNDV